MMNPLSLPRQEDVADFDFGAIKASLISVTEENRPEVMKACLSNLIGDSCKFCGRVIETIEDAEGMVWAGDGTRDGAGWACPACWNINALMSVDE